jgi:predicted transcriptional regulator
MKQEDINILLENVRRPIYKIEEDLGMPKTTLQKTIKGERRLPKKWAILLKDYVKTSAWISANAKDATKPPVISVLNANKQTNIVEPKKTLGSEKTNYSINTQNDPKEGSMAFYNKYGVMTYSEIKK